MQDPASEGRNLAFAAHALRGEFFHQVCFVAQQSAEKALKAIHFADGARSVIGHSAVGLLARLLDKRPQLEPLNDLAAELDLYSIPTRYPNGLVEGVPHRAFTRTQAERAMGAARSIVEAAKDEIAT